MSAQPDAGHPAEGKHSRFGGWLEKHQTWVYIGLGLVGVVIAWLSLRAQSSGGSAAALPAPSVLPSSGGGSAGPSVSTAAPSSGGMAWARKHLQALQTAQAAQAGQSSTLATEIAALQTSVAEMEAAAKAAVTSTTSTTTPPAVQRETAPPVAPVQSTSAAAPSTPAEAATVAPSTPARTWAPVSFPTRSQPGTPLYAAQQAVTRTVAAARQAVTQGSATPSQRVEAAQGTATLTPWQQAWLNSGGNTTVPAAPGASGVPTTYRNGVPVKG